MSTTVDMGQSTTERLTRQIVTLIADRENVDPLDLPPLNDAINPDALNALFNKPESTINHIRFCYDGYEITIEGEGQVEATPLEEAST